ncbi:MAG TPA: hypothetical protein VJ673_07850 [Aromatoleum sp.]|uniref:hypothetical protein n=1 Tax=Aromatoleum sp. TaxID=2307007 RepID=UPI002B4A6CAD|nr:hypothetical protein [Aromatoleum sp.]HJV25585.1 hypothetical protein [Aromatoleum sp.]
MEQLYPLLAVALAMAMFIPSAHADPTSIGEAAIADGTETIVAEAPQPTLLGTAALDDAALDGQRGGADTHRSDLSAVGSVSEVAVSDAVTGQNLIAGGALSGASGIPMFIQNSGNGVLIQNAVILNVDVR